MRISNIHPVSTRQIKQRTCVACRKIKNKLELIRLVRTPEGNIEIDSCGKKAGRGAYLCPNWECWEIALKGRQLEHTLRSSLSQYNRDQLVKQGQELLKGVN
ncbi:RNase P modulator RnpM [Chloroflexota bacterium]